MLYDIREDIVDPNSGEVLAEKGEQITDPERQELVDIIIDEANSQYEILDHPVYRVRETTGKKIIERWTE